MNDFQPPKTEKNKERTKRALIDAVGTIFRTEGFAGLGVNKAAKIAGVHKKLIYRYFGDLNGLVEAYIVETDYWMVLADGIRVLSQKTTKGDIEKTVRDILTNLFLYFRSAAEMQQIILWELSTKSDLMRSIHRTRESAGQQILEMTDLHFRNTQVNFRAIAALLVGGIYYMILHSRHNGHMFSDMDLSTEEGKQDIIKAIGMIVQWSFDVK